MRKIATAVSWLCACTLAYSQALSVNSGTRLRAQMENTIDTKTSRVGDGADAILVEAVQQSGVVIAPVGTRLHGRVTAIHAEDKKQKIHALVQLSFDEVVLPDGRKLRTEASIQNLGVSEDVNSDGVVTVHPFSTDFKLKNGRKLWLRLNQDLQFSGDAVPATRSPVSSLAGESAILKPKEAPQKHEPLGSAVSAGTRLRAKMESPIDTKTSRVGDGVDAVLIEPLTHYDVVLLPIGTGLHGRVATIRAADKKQRAHALLRIAFDELILPDGRHLKARASIQSLGSSEAVDSEGAATMAGVSKGESVEATVTGGAAGAGIGAIAGGGKGAELGAGIGGAVGLLSALAAGVGQWENFELKKGRKLWLRLDEDVLLESSAPAPSLRK